MQSGRANVIHKDHIHKQPTQYVSMSVSLVHTTAVSDAFKVDILGQYINDDVGRLCQTDPTIRLIDHSLYAMVKQKPDKKSGVKSSVKANMRMLGNLYTDFR